MAQEARAEGVGEAGIAALMAASYSKGTIAADRNQKSFKYSLAKFMEVRGGDAVRTAPGRAPCRDRAAGAGHGHTKARPAEIVLDHPGEAVVVVDHQDAFGHYLSIVPAPSRCHLPLALGH